MTVFWIIAAGLILIALAFAALPLLRNQSLESVDQDELNVSLIKQQLTELDADLANGSLDQAQYDAARRDLERELLQDVRSDEKRSAAPRSGLWALAVVAAGIPLGAVGFYQTLGNEEIIGRLATFKQMTAGSPRTAARPSQTSAGAPEHNKDLPAMNQLVEKLHEKLMQNPANIEGWLLLGRSYVSMGRIEDGLNAYQSAYQQAPNDPDVLVSYAQGLARAKGNDFSGEPANLIRTAYQADPKHPTAIWMMGLLHFNQGEYQTTIDYWQQLAAMLPPDSNQGKELARYIAQAKERLAPGSSAILASPAVQSAAQAPAVAQAKTPSNAPAATSGKAIRVRVSLDPTLAAQAAPTDRVFIFARALSGPPMPLAAVSKQVRDLPLELTLDDSLAMMPQMKLSLFPQVRVGARVSKSGNAMPQSGDLQGEVSPVEPGQAGTINVNIDSVRP